MRPLHVSVTAAALAALLSVSTLARATPSAGDRAEAKALAVDGRKALKDKRWSQAVVALKKAHRLDPSPALALDLAQAQIGGGKLLEASKTLARLAEGTESAPPARKAREAAKKLLAELAPRLATIKVRVTGAANASVTLRIDAVEVEGGTDLAIDPGDHTVSAAADDFIAAEKDVHVAEGEHARVALRLARLAPVAVAAAGVDTRTGSRAPGAVVTTLGAAGLLAGGIFGGLAFSATSSARANCVGNVCSAAAIDDISRSRTYGNVSTAAFIGGGALALTGIVLLVVAPGGPPESKSDAAAQGAHVSPWIGSAAPDGVGVGALSGMSVGASGSF